MLTNPTATTVLCYGDSNTYGYHPEPPWRWPADTRWPGRLQTLLGADYQVIEEGLPGRTTDLDYVDRIGRNGRTYLTPCLDTHYPLDVVVLMLGTNDVKFQFGRSAKDIAAALATLIDDIQTRAQHEDGRQPRIVLLSPAHVDDQAPLFAELNGYAYDAGSVAKSKELATHLRALAEERGLAFGDAATVAPVTADGVHLDAEAHANIAALAASLLTS